jgi:triacylglycerol lipase
MQSRSALARLQQGTTLSVLAAALAWAWYWRATPWLALAGFALIAFFYSLVLAVEFIALRFFGGGDPAPRPTTAELLRAWLSETLAAPRVFCWRQPFRWREIPDHLEPSASTSPKRGVVFIHGFVCNRGFWNPWMNELRDRGHCFAAVNLEPIFGSIDAYVPIVEAAVDRVTRATGLPPVLVCHSMGGLAARAWLCAMKADTRVHRVVTIGSPHHGTWLARFSHLTNGRQMQRQGEWLRCLHEQGGADGHSRFTCWYSNCDNIVFPASTATLDGADNRLVRGVAHVALAFHPQVMHESLVLIAAM